MSASEKLRILDGRMQNPMRETGWNLVDWDSAGFDRDALIALRNSLPQIIALVEAIEQAHPWSIAPPPRGERVLLIGPALVALDKALE